MKKIKNIIMSAAAFAAAGLGLSSCDIDMLPLNEVVYENFWTNKDDVDNVVTSCYSAMTSFDYVRRLVVWGELRGDNVSQGPNVNDDNEIKFLLKGSIKTTNGYNNWASFYTVINRCNVVLAEAPLVAEKDPNYTTSDLRINIAECKFLRAYSYFTLVKTFKDVPFTYEASFDDSQNYRLPQTSGDSIITALIADIEECKDYAPNKYSDKYSSIGKVTRPAMYSLLADLYLWKASDAKLSKEEQNENYKKCIECCDWVIRFKKNQYDSNDFFNEPNIREDMDKYVHDEYGYPLLAEEKTPGTNNGGPLATQAIFNKCFSFETIFEMGFYNGLNTTLISECVTGVYGTETGKNQKVVASEKLFESKPETNATYSDNRLFSVPSDYRSITSFYFNENNGGYNIYKYCLNRNYAGEKSYNYGSVGTQYTAATETQTYGGYANWILYRLTDIMLMRAEAEIELANNLANAVADETPDETPGDNAGDDNNAETQQSRATRAVAVDGSTLSTSAELYDDAFNLISAVYRRSNPIVKNKPAYAPSNGNSGTFAPKNGVYDYTAYHTLLMNERRRELLFEGKRYFDLVREARRNGNTRAFRQAMSNKFSDSNPAVAVKMVQMDFLYMPVLKAEMKVNPLLKQNSCYLDEEENTKN